MGNCVYTWSMICLISNHHQFPQKKISRGIFQPFFLNPHYQRTVKDEGRCFSVSVNSKDLCCPRACSSVRIPLSRSLLEFSFLPPCVPHPKPFCSASHLLIDKNLLYFMTQTLKKLLSLTHVFHFSCLSSPEVNIKVNKIWPLLCLSFSHNFWF